MNKQQILFPAGLILVVIFLVAVIHGRNQTRVYLLAKSQEIGVSIIGKTNSPLVVTLGPKLQSRLDEFFSQSARIERVSLGDERAPIGDGLAESQLWLVNDRYERIVIRLRRDSNPGRFHILGFWTPSAGPKDSNH